MPDKEIKQQPDKQELIEAFSALSEDETNEVPEIFNDPAFIKDIMSIKVGDYVDIEVSDDNYKKKYFTTQDRETKVKNLVRKKCRVAGEAKNNFYGLGYFIAPEGVTKNPFPLYINEYGITWVAFTRENENHNSG